MCTLLYCGKIFCDKKSRVNISGIKLIEEAIHNIKYQEKYNFCKYKGRPAYLEIKR